jgi:hypothetical protein
MIMLVGSTSRQRTEPSQLFRLARGASRVRLSSLLDRAAAVGVLGLTAHLGVAPRGAFWSRTTLPTVARWFVPDARETVNNFIQVQAA